MTFRLTEEEWEGVYRVCLAQGARSFADFVRAAVLEKIECSQELATSMGLLGQEVRTVSAKVEALLSEIRQVHDLLDQSFQWKTQQ